MQVRVKTPHGVYKRSMVAENVEGLIEVLKVHLNTIKEYEEKWNETK